MYFVNGAETIIDIVREEKIELNKIFEEDFFIVLSELCAYSEEEHKIRPQIIMGRSLDAYFKSNAELLYQIGYINNAAQIWCNEVITRNLTEVKVNDTWTDLFIHQSSKMEFKEIKRKAMKKYVELVGEE